MFKQKLREYASANREIGSIVGDIKTILGYSGSKLKKERAGLYGVSLLKILSFPLGLSIVYITKFTLDQGILAKNLEVFLKLTVLGLVVFFLMRLMGYFSSKITMKVKTRFALDVNRDLTGRLFGAPYLRIKQLSADENAYVIGYDYRNIENLIFSEIPACVSLVKLPVFFILSAMISLPLTLLVLVSLPFVGLHTLWASRVRNRNRTREILYSQKHSSFFHDILGNIKLIKSFNKEGWALSRVMFFFGKRIKNALKSSLFFYRSNFIEDLFVKMVTALFWMLGGYLIIKGKLSLGSFSAVAMYTALIVSETYSISAIIQGINQERFSIKRSAAFIEEFSGAAGDSSITPLSYEGICFDKDIEFKDISFGYKHEKPILRDLSFVAPEGKWTLLKGGSGEGKTTLLSIFLRLFSPDEGDVYIGGKNIAEMAGREIGGNISAVHQEPYLLNTTIINNILLGEKRASEEIEKVIACTKLDKLVASTNQGYNMRVGESGSAISGGQRQRVAIARALIREPKILVLDEATSFIDPAMEGEIFWNIKEFYPDLTVLFVTQRDTGKTFADEVFTLENGRVERETEDLKVKQD